MKKLGVSATSSVELALGLLVGSESSEGIGTKQAQRCFTLLSYHRGKVVPDSARVHLCCTWMFCDSSASATFLGSAIALLDDLEHLNKLKNARIMELT